MQEVPAGRGVGAAPGPGAQVGAGLRPRGTPVRRRRPSAVRRTWQRLPRVAGAHPPGGAGRGACRAALARPPWSQRLAAKADVQRGVTTALTRPEKRGFSLLAGGRPSGFVMNPAVQLKLGRVAGEMTCSGPHHICVQGQCYPEL